MKKVLLVGEFTLHKSGYSIYGYEVMSRLYKMGRYNIAELAAYCRDDDPRIKDVPWPVFPNQPPPGQDQFFNPESEHVFGSYRLEETLNKFRPDIVFSFRDYWMDRAIYGSPYRDYFAYVEMPTVDATPQHPEWLNAYKEADALLTYQDWSKKELEKNKLKVLGSAPPVASDDYFVSPDKEKIRESLGLKNAFIVGMVARNQKRKLFPSLFRDFKEFSKDKDNTLLYLHTGYPDNGWEIPTLIKEFGLENKVIFTYFCSCGYIHPKLFSGEKTFCNKCGRNESFLVQPSRAIDNRNMALIYNTFDVYVQYCSNEGFGMPIGEAACCGLPVLGTNYSALEDIIPKIKGIPIECSLEKEIDTGRYFAVPNGKDFIQKLNQLYSLPKKELRAIGLRTKEEYHKNYSWDKTVNEWVNAFEQISAKKSWNSPPNFHNPAQFNDYPQADSYSYAGWLISEVLGDKSKLNSFFHTRLARDLDRGMWNEIPNGGYYDERSHLFTKNRWAEFTRKTGYDLMLQYRDRVNKCEQARCSQ